MESDLLDLLSARRGHFKLESGHHGDLWLDLDALFLRPRAIRRFAVDLASRMAVHRIDGICGPLAGGAFVAQMVADGLNVDFYHSERVPRTPIEALYPVAYRLPEALRKRAEAKRIAIVDDAINAGSAVRATLADLRVCGAEPVALGALLVLGAAAESLAAAHGLPLERVASLPNQIWPASECPLCAAGRAIDVAQLAPVGC